MSVLAAQQSTGRTELTFEQSAQLEASGYTVVPRFLDRSLTGRLRQHIDSLLAERKPDGRTDLRHPISGEILAEALFETELIPLAASLLFSKDLRLLEQVLIRTDPAAPGAARGPNGWHVDMAFHPDEYNARPRRTYFHHVHALSTVEPGGGAFTIVPGSHHKTYAATAGLLGEGELEQFKKDPAGVAKVDLSEAIEVCPEDGDLLIFNPMCLHSASTNTRSTPRYVYFASFMDASAAYLQRSLNAMKYKRALPEELVRRISREYSKLYEW